MPADIPPHKYRQARSRVSSPAQRLEMLRLAVRGDDLFEVSDPGDRPAGAQLHLRDAVQLRQARGPEAQLYWIIGADMLADLPNWYQAAEVVDMAISSPPPARRPARPGRPPGRASVRLSETSGRIAAGILDTPLVDISSTQICHRLRDGKSIRYLTPETVVQYIQQEGLYHKG